MQEELGSVQIGCYVAHTSELGEFSHADLYEIQKFSRPVIWVMHSAFSYREKLIWPEIVMSWSDWCISAQHSKAAATVVWKMLLLQQLPQAL